MLLFDPPHSLMRHLASFQPEILALFVYAILLIMWLKFLVIWRLFRLWALCDGVEPPENMQVRVHRCTGVGATAKRVWYSGQAARDAEPHSGVIRRKF